MDTSKKYIKMCEKAVEIQAERILGRCEFGDLFYLEDGFAHGGKCRFVGSYDGYETDDGYSIIDKTLVEESIWLPRQDQLQGILDTYYKDEIYILISDFFNFAWEEPMPSYRVPRKPTFASMEQLWLAFVMFERFGKTWSGTDWIKET